MAVIGIGRRIDGVDCSPLTAVARPISHRRHHDARRGIGGNLGHGFERAAIIEDPDRTARRNPPRGRIIRAQDDLLRPGVVQLRLHVAVRRVEKRVAFRREHVQRKARRECRICRRRFIGRDVVRQRIDRLARLLARIALPEQRQDQIAAGGD